MDFYKRVEYVCRKIPYGKVATYGQIALLCGKPRNARQVGHALSHRLAGEVPAHRILNSSGFLSGAGTFKDNYEQERLLKKECVKVNDGQIVDLKSFGWKHSLEEAMNFRNWFEENGI